jgi:hypothetical protein
LATKRPSTTSSPNGFEVPGAAAREAWARQPSEARNAWMQFRPTTIVSPLSAMRLATDAWPFLYLQHPMIPSLSLRGMAIMGTVGVLFLLPFVRRRASDATAGVDRASSVGFLAQMFFLGAGFMLIETKAVVQMALLFGSTWMVNSIVFCAVLAMILVANLFVLTVRPESVKPFYVGLILSLIVGAIVPMDAFLGLSRSLQITGSCLFAFTPIFFAGIVFAASFSHATDADRAFGANIAGAMFGGLSEYSSMLLGFQYLVLLAVVFYALAAAGAFGESSRAYATG